MRGIHSLMGKVALGVGLIWVALVATGAGQQGNNAVAVDSDDIGGVVTGAKGPEAGVWVIAETTDLPTKFAKIVVTDDRGRYLMPDLPKANYNVWVRGYGLVDSPKVKAAPGKTLNLTAVVAPNAKAAARAVLPGGLLDVAAQRAGQERIPGKGGANNFSPNIKSQDHFLALMKTGDIFGSCMTCHQLGDKATREIPKELGTFANSRDAWLRRIQSGQAGADMVKMFSFMGMQRTVAMFADWTDRIAAGELPPAPPRPPASSGTSSSRSGTGATRRRISMTLPSPTGAIRR